MTSTIPPYAGQVEVGTEPYVPKLQTEPTRKPPAPARLRGAPYVYEQARRARREELLRERAEVETAAVRLMKSALRMGGVYGGLAAALDIAAETAGDLVALDHRLAAYVVPAPAATFDRAVDAALTVAGGWVPRVVAS